MNVMLSSTGNPDYGQNPHEILFGSEDNLLVKVQSFKEASRKCRDFIQLNGLGSGNWSGGRIYDDDGNCIARVSYNGRVWNTEQQEIV